MGVAAQFLPDIGRDLKRTRQGDRQTEDIDQRVAPVSTKISDGDCQVVLEHHLPILVQERLTAKNTKEESKRCPEHEENRRDFSERPYVLASRRKRGRTEPSHRASKKRRATRLQES
jgi:hypothetical protein